MVDVIRALLWAARTYLAAQLLILVALFTLFSWVPRIGKPLRCVSAVLVRWAVRLIGFKAGRPRNARTARS